MLEQRLGVLLKDGRVLSNPLTGSVLITGNLEETRAFVHDAESEKLFHLEEGPQNDTVFQSIVEPLHRIDTTLQNVSGGALTFPSALFLFLIASGLFDLLRNGFRVPPWYTALWYAFGLSTLMTLQTHQTASYPHAE